MKLFQGRKGGLKEDCYATLLEHGKRAASVIEFGPGGSTYAFIEAGCEKIVTCEHDDEWLAKAEKRFAEYDQVQVLRYRNEPKVVVEGLHGRASFDLAFVDSPLGVAGKRLEHPGQEGCARLNTLEYALKRAPVVLLHDAHRDGEQASLERIKADGHKVEMIPGRGNMARITRAD